MTISRRAALGVIAGAFAAPSIVRAADRGSRTFTVLRAGDEFGYQKNTVARRGDEITSTVDIELKVRRLGITLFRYELQYTEVWKGGRLQSFESSCNDDGEAAFAKVSRKGGVLEVEGSGYQGPAPDDAATSSYWSYAFMNRPIWISTQSGELFSMKTAQAGKKTIATAAGDASVDVVQISGGYEAEVWYKAQDWVGIAFDAGGEPAVYVPDDVSPQFKPVWNA